MPKKSSNKENSYHLVKDNQLLVNVESLFFDKFMNRLNQLEKKIDDRVAFLDNKKLAKTFYNKILQIENILDDMRKLVGGDDDVEYSDIESDEDVLVKS